MDRIAYPEGVGKVYEGIDAKLAAWLTAQPMFVVATAPLDPDGLLNVSPKGMLGTFTVLDEHTVAYLDITGSGVETIAHLRQNGRIVLMFTAFDGRPNIVRLHGTGTVVLPDEPRFAQLRPKFSDHPGIRSIIVVSVARVSDSCGYAVPHLAYIEDRTVLDLSNAKKGEDGLVDYRKQKNSVSLDGLPGLV
jgi:hypothetical protein